jgi:hypothetical protein
MLTTESTAALTAASLGILDYEIVMAEFGFYISINGFVDLTKCSGYSLDASGHIVLKQEHGEVFLQQVPEMFAKLIDEQEAIIFARYEDGEMVDAENLVRKF